MKKQPVKKLNLNRETLQTLNSKELEGVAGAATPSIVIAASVFVSAMICAPSPAK